MRITGGRLKGIRIPAGFAAHVRPTTDMMRESLFNKLQHGKGVEDMRVLDLFFGSGLVSLEFTSRNAASVTSVDRDAKNIAALKNVLTRLEIRNVDVIKKDVFTFLQQTELKWDIIFADPPYDLPNLQELISLAIPCLAADGLFILEHRPGITLNGPVRETKKQGSTALTIFAV